MDYKQFEEIVLERLQQRYSEEEVVMHDVRKNNSIMYRGISIRDKDSNISPTIYTDSFYSLFQNGKTLDDVVNDICDTYERHRVPEMACDIVSDIHDYDRVAGRIYYTVINAERNKALLSECPHRSYLDLAVVYRLSISMGDRVQGSSLIKNELMETWAVTEQELFEVAQKNTPMLMKPELKDMWMILSEIYGRNNAFEDYPSYMYVASNSERCNGAAVIFLDSTFRSVTTDQVAKEFIIIPSSVHETIIIPYNNNDIDRDTVLNLVREVNRTEVQSTEVLSDNVYICKDNIIQIWN